MADDIKQDFLYGYEEIDDDHFVPESDYSDTGSPEIPILPGLRGIHHTQ